MRFFSIDSGFVSEIRCAHIVITQVGHFARSVHIHNEKNYCASHAEIHFFKVLFIEKFYFA